jgi:hypothetical protein
MRSAATANVAILVAVADLLLLPLLLQVEALRLCSAAAAAAAAVVVVALLPLLLLLLCWRCSQHATHTSSSSECRRMRTTARHTHFLIIGMPTHEDNSTPHTLPHHRNADA